jgi:hypothetical protein
MRPSGLVVQPESGFTVATCAFNVAAIEVAAVTERNSNPLIIVSWLVL